MIPVPSGARVWLAAGHTDMRKGSDGLALMVLRICNRATWSTALASTRAGLVAAPLPAKRNAGAGLLLEDATMSKLLWMLLVIGSAWADDDGRRHLEVRRGEQRAALLGRTTGDAIAS